LQSSTKKKQSYSILIYCKISGGPLRIEIAWMFI
jgi:hypothetical protein